jgi:hypothetical protein
MYTMLLLIAWIAILLGILCLYLEMKEYDFKFKDAPVAQLSQPIATSPLWAVGCGEPSPTWCAPPAPDRYS